MASKWCLISWADGADVPVDPSFGVGLGGHPSQGLPVPPMYPSHGLPGGGHISTLPVFPFDPTIGIDNTLPTPPVYPSGQPIAPGTKLIVKWLCGFGLIAVPEPKA